VISLTKKRREKRGARRTKRAESGENETTLFHVKQEWIKYDQG
jgi:hypothetical protein